MSDKLPPIIRRQFEESFKELHHNIITANFPASFREGIYQTALEHLTLWEKGELELEQFAFDRTHPIMLSRHFFWQDKAILDFNNRKEKIKEFPDSEDDIDESHI